MRITRGKEQFMKRSTSPEAEILSQDRFVIKVDYEPTQDKVLLHLGVIPPWSMRSPFGYIRSRNHEMSVSISLFT